MTDYSLKTLMMEENPTVVFRGIAGSHAYGTNNAQSDVDIRGVFVVPSGEYVRLTPPPKQVLDERNDITYYSLLRFCELLLSANPTALEMLYLPKECVLKTSAIYELLRSRREIFVTQKAVDSHLGYSISQIRKARGCNKRVWNPMPEEPPAPTDYCFVVEDAKGRPVAVSKSGVDLRNCKVAELGKGAASDVFALFDYGVATGGVFRDGQLVVSPTEEVDGDRRIGIMIFNRQGFESAKRQHREYWEWKRNRNESRWIQQERGELDFDAKNMMHLMRMLISGENIVQHGEPIVRFADEKLEMLLAIRRGEWSFEKILECAERIKARIEAGKNRLPKDVDEEKINELIAEAMKLTEVR